MFEEGAFEGKEKQNDIITTKEKEYLQRAAKGAKMNGHFMEGLSLFLMAIGIWLLLMFFDTAGPVERISLIGVIVCAAIIMAVALRYLWPKRARLDIEGIAVPPSREMDHHRVIKYGWIEQIIMNDRTNGDAYAIVLFTDDMNDRYAYHIPQRGLEDPADFVVKLREKGIYVRILNPSCLRQKYLDVYWMSELVKGRKVIYR